MTKNVNISHAKANLSRLVDQAPKGQEFIITRAGKPIVLVVPLEASSAGRKLGFMVGQGVATADVKTDVAAEIAAMFGLSPSARPPE
jgi:prevent-host-death family protein